MPQLSRLESLPTEIVERIASFLCDGWYRGLSNFKNLRLASVRLAVKSERSFGERFLCKQHIRDNRSVEKMLFVIQHNTFRKTLHELEVSCHPLAIDRHSDYSMIAKPTCLAHIMSQFSQLKGVYLSGSKGNRTNGQKWIHDFFDHFHCPSLKSLRIYYFGIDCHLIAEQLDKFNTIGDLVMDVYPISGSMVEILEALQRQPNLRYFNVSVDGRLDDYRRTNNKGKGDQFSIDWEPEHFCYSNRGSSRPDPTQLQRLLGVVIEKLRAPSEPDQDQDG